MENEKMNEFKIESHPVNPQDSAATGDSESAAGSEQAGIRDVPVEDLGLGIVRLFQGGVSGITALGKGDALSGVIKKTADELNSVLDKALLTVSGLVKRANPPKE
jgi:hypothetical protein